MRQEYSWFTHDVIKNQTKKLSILLNFYFQGSRFKFIFALFKLIQYKMAYRISKLTEMMKNKINITYKFVDMYTVTKVAEAFVLVTVPFE